MTDTKTESKLYSENTVSSVVTPDANAIADALQTELASMLPPHDVPGNWSERERDAYEARRSLLRGRITTIQQATATIAKLTPKLTVEQNWLTDLQVWRRLLIDELDHADVHDAGRIRNLTLSLGVINRGVKGIENDGFMLVSLRLGALMIESGYTTAKADDAQTYGELPFHRPLSDTEAMIADLTKQIADAQTSLALALEDDAARAKRAADAQLRYLLDSEKPQRKTRGDGSQYDKYPDGRRVEVNR